MDIDTEISKEGVQDDKALFGPREPPILWKKLFARALQDIGFKPIPHETCCLTYYIQYSTLIEPQFQEIYLMYSIQSMH